MRLWMGVDGRRGVAIDEDEGTGREDRLEVSGMGWGVCVDMSECFFASIRLQVCPPSSMVCGRVEGDRRRGESVALLRQRSKIQRRDCIIGCTVAAIPHLLSRQNISGFPPLQDFNQR